MAYRLWGLVGCGVALAVACSGDDGKKQVASDDSGGAAGEAGALVSSAGSPLVPSAGAGANSGGEPASGGSGGEPSDGGAGGAPVSEGGASGAPMDGGAAGAPTSVVSACGEGNYDSNVGCSPCPSLPIQNDPTIVTCADFTNGYPNNDPDLLLTFRDLPLHEPLGGKVTVSWKNTTQQTNGEATVTWSYSVETGQFTIDLPQAAAGADQFDLATWTFSDACGFLFSASNLRIDYNGEGWDCLNPT